MVICQGEPDLSKLKTGVTEYKDTETQTRNLGELFREAKSNQSFMRSKDSKKPPFDTGIKNLKLSYTKQCRQGFQWRYSYVDEDGKRKTIVRVNLWALIEEVARRKLEWKIINEKNAQKTAEKAGLQYWEIL